MDEVQAAWDAWDRARNLVVSMLNQQSAARDLAAYEAAACAEAAARSAFYRTASDHHRVALPFDADDAGHHLDALTHSDDPLRRAKAASVVLTALGDTQSAGHAERVAVHHVMADALREAQHDGITIEQLAVQLDVTHGRILQLLSPSPQES